MPPARRSEVNHLTPTSESAGPVEVSPEKAALTEETVRGALKEADGNKRQAARILGISRATLYRFLDKVHVIE